MEKIIVEFKFIIDQIVITPFDEKGIVTMLGFDDSGQVYYVKSKSSSEWFKEKELKYIINRDRGYLDD